MLPLSREWGSGWRSGEVAIPISLPLYREWRCTPPLEGMEWSPSQHPSPLDGMESWWSRHHFPFRELDKYNNYTVSSILNIVNSKQYSTNTM